MTSRHVDPETSDIIQRRGITQVLHFTTNRGLLGILASAEIRSRASLQEDQYLSRIFLANAPTRRDPAWVAHTSLSVSRINYQFLQISQNWHAEEDLWWCVIDIDPSVLGHDGVVFCTVNNIWPSVQRSVGPEGLESLFAEAVTGRYQSHIARPPGANAAWPTCLQAEVLYPGAIPTDLIQRVYFRCTLHRAAGEAMMAAVGHPALPSEVNEAVYTTGTPL